MSRTFSSVVVACAAAATLAGCTVKSSEAPALSGPSEYGLSLRTSVVPDQIGQDGLSQAQIEMVARGPDGRPARAVALRVEIAAGGVLADYGRLSSRTAVTGDDGIARVVYTAPPPLADPIDPFTVVTFLVTPIGNDFAGSNSRTVELRLVPPATVPTILPPNGAPVPAFFISPTPVTTYRPVAFNASATQDEGSPCGANCSYAWDFGDGTAATGMVVNHEFKQQGAYVVRLTVTDVRGRSASLSQAVTVTQTPAPTADFVFSPAAPFFGQDVFFNAATSRAATGHTIVGYDWDFGSGRTGSGVTVSKRYGFDLIPPGAASGAITTFNVVLTVTDDTFAPTGRAVVMKPVAVKVP